MTTSKAGPAGEFTVAVTGDMLADNRISACQDPGFLEVVDLLRGVDVVHTQLEFPVTDGTGPESYPSAEGGWLWTRAPRYMVEELRWLGVDLVSTASNHTLDYSVGGLRDTIAALDAIGMPHAGIGEDLAAARAPAFLDTAHGRIALISACPSIPNFARAGATRSDVRGRPGANPLRYYHRVDRATADRIIELYRSLGYWVTKVGDEFAINPPGVHNTLQRFAISDDDGVTTVPDEDDLAGNLAAIRHGLIQADFVIAHLHVHEWDAADGRLSSSPAFVEAYARAAIDEGAHVVIVQGSHAPLRGIEVHHGRPIFYDPGDLFSPGARWRAQPADFYRRWGLGPEARQQDAGLPEALQGLAHASTGASDEGRILSPGTFYSNEPGFFVPVLTVRDDFTISRVTIHPGTHLVGSPVKSGYPSRATGEPARVVLEHLDELCRPYGTKLQIDGDRAYIDLD